LTEARSSSLALVRREPEAGEGEKLLSRKMCQHSVHVPEGANRARTIFWIKGGQEWLNIRLECAVACFAELPPHNAP
jgi:hypothetical protein